MKFENQTIENQEVFVDGNQFFKVKFRNCRIVFMGVAPMAFDSCDFISSPIQFAGSAANTLKVLQVMHASGGVFKDLVENVFKEIRTAGAPINVVTH